MVCEPLAEILVVPGKAILFPPALLQLALQSLGVLEFLDELGVRFDEFDFQKLNF